MIAVYQEKLNTIVDGFDEQIRTYIKEKDAQAREVLSALGDRLAECENITYLDYCIGLQQGCDSADVNPDIIVVDETDPLCASIGALPQFQCSELACHVIGCQEVYNKGAPVFYFEAPDSFLATNDIENQSNTTRICESLCWLVYGTNSNAFGTAARGTIIPSKCITYPALPSPSGVNAYMNPAPPTIAPELSSGTIANLASQFQSWASDLASKLNNGRLMYEKIQLQYRGNPEFPAGKYVFVYEGGGFRQERLNSDERFDEPPNSDLLIDGPFNDYFVGNEGDGDTLGPFFILNPYDHSKSVQVSMPDIASTRAGLDIGVAPLTYQNLVPLNYFAVHAFNPYEFSGEGATDTPLSYVDPIGLDIQVGANEDLIKWNNDFGGWLSNTPAFPVSGIDGCELPDLQSYYMQGSLAGRCVVIELTAPSFIFMRVRTA